MKFLKPALYKNQTQVIQGVDGGSVSIYHDTRGEPYRDGLLLLCSGEGETGGENAVLLDPIDAFQLATILAENVGFHLVRKS